MRKENAVAAPVTVQAPIVIASGLGAVVTDVDGNSFLDFAGGIGCLAAATFGYFASRRYGHRAPAES